MAKSHCEDETNNALRRELTDRVRNGGQKYADACREIAQRLQSGTVAPELAGARIPTAAGTQNVTPEAPPAVDPAALMEQVRSIAGEVFTSFITMVKSGEINLTPEVRDAVATDLEAAAVAETAADELEGLADRLRAAAE
jgi:hypothetical protein